MDYFGAYDELKKKRRSKTSPFMISTFVEGLRRRLPGLLFVFRSTQLLF